MENVTDAQIALISGIVGTLLGTLGTILTKWIEKKKPKIQENVEVIQGIAQAASTSVDTAKTLADMARGLMEDQRDSFKEEIARQVLGAKEDCNEKIEELKRENELKLETMMCEIKTLTDDKSKLQARIIVLEADNRDLNAQVIELEKRLKKYERRETGPLHQK